MNEPEWSPVTDEWLAAIIADAARGGSFGVWSASDIYALAREVRFQREMRAARCRGLAPEGKQ